MHDDSYILFAKLLNPLFFLQRANKQSSILLSHNIPIQALHNYLTLIGCMNHAVVAIEEADVVAHHCIASLVLWEQSMEATPTAQVTPSKLGWQSIDFLRLLHHSIVDAYLLTGWEKFANYFFLLFGIERRSHLVHDVGEIWLEGTDSLTDGIDIPYEDSGIPIVIASGKVLLGCFLVWFFLESLYLVDFIY